jgi:hypothetical protein
MNQPRSISTTRAGRIRIVGAIVALGLQFAPCAFVRAFDDRPAERSDATRDEKTQKPSRTEKAKPSNDKAEASNEKTAKNRGESSDEISKDKKQDESTADKSAADDSKGKTIDSKGSEPQRAPRPARVINPRERKRSKFLAPPGTVGSYDEKTDWNSIPPWLQTSFFGIRAKGKTFIYVVDCSGSMAEGDRMTRAKSELRKTVNTLRYPQSFHVIFYNDKPLTMPGGTPRVADALSKDDLIRWLRNIDSDGGTDPREAMAIALGFRPDAIFLLSDGAFPEQTVEAIAKLNKVKTPIHCVDLSGGAGGDDLARIAKESGGVYVLRP